MFTLEAAAELKPDFVAVEHISVIREFFCT
jgi:hypothetical protein